MSSEQLQRLAGIVDRWVKDGSMQGVSYVVMRKGKIVAHEVFGKAVDAPEPVPVTKETIFGLASLSKIVMGTAAMILIDRGELSLDDTIADLLPDFSSKGKGVITVKQLLTHSSGMGWIPDVNMIADLMAREASEEEWKQAAREAPLTFEPGTAVEYSPSLGPAILKWRVEKKTGMEIEEFCQKKIFGPLGMKDTSFRPRREVWPRIAKLPASAGAVVVGLANSEYARTRLTAVWGSLFSTPEDIARLMQAYLNGGELGGYRLLSSDMVSLGTRVHTESIPLKPMAPGEMGFLFTVKGERSGFMTWRFGDMTSPATFGFGGGNYTWAWVDPERELVAVFFSNTPAGDDAAVERREQMRVFADTVVSAVLPE
ncbi:MAG: serine hydrolase domain-containing protein [Bacillota bacterium]|nr:serine hydrolase domain-containing protein [Bacillota bacterium]